VDQRRHPVRKRLHRVHLELPRAMGAPRRENASTIASQLRGGCAALQFGTYHHGRARVSPAAARPQWFRGDGRQGNRGAARPITGA